jgi:DNA-binding Lrp family transcriptional regulator
MSTIKTPTASWRDVLPIHPAADLFPLMSPDELKALGQDVQKNGMRVPIVLWSESEDTTPVLLDGRHRLDAAEFIGTKVFEVRRDKGNRIDLLVPHRRLYGSGGSRSMIDGSSVIADPYEFVLSANVHRRHLKPEDIPGLIAKILKVRPEMSNRQVAKAVGKSHPHVARIREQLEQAGDVETVTTSIDTKGRRQPAKRLRISDSERELRNYGRMVKAHAKAAADRAEKNAVADRAAEERSQQTQHTTEQIEPQPQPKPLDRPGEGDDGLGALLRAWDRADEHARETFCARIGLIIGIPPFMMRTPMVAS